MTWRSRNCRCASPIDRAGLVGADGATHAGSFDVSYLGILPGMVVMAAADEAELVHMVATAVAYNDGPIAFRYPRGEGVGIELPEHGEVLPIGKGRILREGSKVAILSLGTRLAEALKAAEDLAAYGDLDDGRRRPFRQTTRRRSDHAGSRCNHEVLITVEEGFDRRLRLLRHAGAFWRKVCSTVAERMASSCARWCCPTSSSITTSRKRCMPNRVSTRKASSPRCSRRSAATRTRRKV